MEAKIEIQDLTNQLNSGRLPTNEPVFVLRASDPLAAQLVRDWADRAENGGVPEEKVMRALFCADKMDEWPNKNALPGRKKPKKKSKKAKA